MQWLIDIVTELVLQQMQGMIVLWSGELADIPNGWALCDGTNGTPNLTNRFIVGAGDTYDPNDTGGATTHDHDFTADGHLHALLSGNDIPSNYPVGPIDVTTSTAYVTGTTDASNHLPPYYSLCYIMKL